MEGGCKFNVPLSSRLVAERTGILINHYDVYKNWIGTRQKQLTQCDAWISCLHLHQKLIVMHLQNWYVPMMADIDRFRVTGWRTEERENEEASITVLRNTHCVMLKCFFCFIFLCRCHVVHGFAFHLVRPKILHDSVDMNGLNYLIIHLSWSLISY